METTFWSHFEEPAANGKAAVAEKGTMTRQREEPDQDMTSFSPGYGTKTATREAPDQLPTHIPYGVFGVAIQGDAVKTVTNTREEPEQDKACQVYGAALN